jgi:hypothetical protein
MATSEAVYALTRGSPTPGDILLIFDIYGRAAKPVAAARCCPRPMMW